MFYALLDLYTVAQNKVPHFISFSFFIYRVVQKNGTKFMAP